MLEDEVRPGVGEHGAQGSVAASLGHGRTRDPRSVARRLRGTLAEMTGHRVSSGVQEEEIRARLSLLQSAIGEQASRLAFPGVLRAVEDARGGLHALRSSLAEGRARGFLDQPDLELALADADARGDGVLAATRVEIERAAEALRPRVDELRARAFDPAFTSVLPDAARLGGLSQQRGALDAAIREAELRIRTAVRPFTERIDKVRQRVERMTSTLEHFANAGFSLQTGEAPRVAFAASFRAPPGGEERPGIFFLSNQRVRFEERGQTFSLGSLPLAPKTGAARGLLLDEPVSGVASAEIRREGRFEEEILALRWERGGEACFLLEDGELADFWAQVIGHL